MCHIAACDPRADVADPRHPAPGDILTHCYSGFPNIAGKFTNIVRMASDLQASCRRAGRKDGQQRIELAGDCDLSSSSISVYSNHGTRHESNGKSAYTLSTVLGDSSARRMTTTLTGLHEQTVSAVHVAVHPSADCHSYAVQLEAQIPYLTNVMSSHALGFTSSQCADARGRAHHQPALRCSSCSWRPGDATSRS